MADDLGQGPAIAETEVVETEVKPTEAKSESATDGEKPAAPVRDKIQERFDTLTREKYDALRRADQLEYRLSQLETKLAEQAKPKEVAPPVAPTLESVGYDEGKYQQALIEYARQTVASEARSTIERERAEQVQKIRTETYEKRVGEFVKDHTDYHEKVTNPSLPISQAMAEVIRDSEMGPQVAYFLAGNPDRAAAIAVLPPTGAAREIGRIEARIAAEAEAKKKPAVSQAPPPPPKIEATTEEIETDPDKMAMPDWLKWRNKQLRRKGNK